MAARGSIVRVSSLLMADILVVYAFFVMQNYLTDVWGLSFTDAARIVNLFGGACLLLPVFFLFLVDEFMGNFAMLVLSSAAFTVGIILVWLSTPPILASSTHTCVQYESKCIGHTQRVLFYIGIALVAVGVAGHEISIKPFIKEQGNEEPGPEPGNEPGHEPGNEPVNSSNPWQVPGFFVVVVVTVSGAIAIPHIKPWTFRFGIPAICTAFGTFLFLTGWFWSPYRIVMGQGSPVTNVFRVFVAFARKIFRRYPLQGRQLYRRNDNEPMSFTHTRFLGCLEKAAIIDNPANPEMNRWKLCSITDVEEAKIAVRMIPMWLTFVICGAVSSTGYTYFVEQANHMNRRIGSWNVPAPVLLLFHKTAKDAFKKISNRLLLKWKKYGSPLGIGCAMVFSILCCITAARFETRRLNVMRSHGLSDKPVKEIPMSMFWLLFQYFLLAGLDAFFENSVIAFYENQSPESMTNNYFKYFAKAVSGLGYGSSVLMVHIVGQVKPNWFQFTLNRSRLDKYYLLLAAISSGNLMFYILVAFMYSYKDPEPEARDDMATSTRVPPLDDGDGCACF